MADIFSSQTEDHDQEQRHNAINELRATIANGAGRLPNRIGRLSRYSSSIRLDDGASTIASSLDSSSPGPSEQERHESSCESCRGFLAGLQPRQTRYFEKMKFTRDKNALLILPALVSSWSISLSLIVYLSPSRWLPVYTELGLTPTGSVCFFFGPCCLLISGVSYLLKDFEGCKLISVGSR